MADPQCKPVDPHGCPHVGPWGMEIEPRLSLSAAWMQEYKVRAWAVGWRSGLQEQSSAGLWSREVPARGGSKGQLYL